MYSKEGWSNGETAFEEPVTEDGEWRMEISIVEPQDINVALFFQGWPAAVAANYGGRHQKS